MKYMIERRFGRCNNRDWLAVYGPGDQSTTWTLGVHRAMTFQSKAQAQLMVDNVILAARRWDNGTDFRFVVIENRQHLPHFYASTDA